MDTTKADAWNQTGSLQETQGDITLGGPAKADFKPRVRPDCYMNCYRRISFGCVCAGAWLQKAHLALTR